MQCHPHPISSKLEYPSLLTFVVLLQSDIFAFEPLLNSLSKQSPYSAQVDSNKNSEEFPVPNGYSEESSMTQLHIPPAEGKSLHSKHGEKSIGTDLNP